MNFKSVDVDDYTVLKVFFSEQPHSLSIYSPASIIAWSNHRHTARYAISDATLYISGEQDDHPEERHLLLPLGGKRPLTPAELHAIAQRLGFKRYWYVPGDFLENLDRKELDLFFRIEEQRGFEDYIYLADDLIHLRGNKFSKKRNLINQFTREYLMRNRIDIQPIRPEDVAECLKYLDTWCERHQCDVDRDYDLACELKAATTTLCNLDRLESKGIYIRIDGEIVAFGVGSRLNASTGVLNFEKAFPDIKGLYQFLDNECAKRLFDGFRYINKESDMNLPSLSESKQSYYPVARVKSFALILR
jgi:hypothetical protein